MRMGCTDAELQPDIFGGNVNNKKRKHKKTKKTNRKNRRNTKRKNMI